METLNARLRVFYDTVAAVGAGDQTIAVRPAQTGIVWRILWAYARHVSGGARQMEWEYTTPEDGTVELGGRPSISDFQGLHLGGSHVSASPAAEFWSTYERYPTAILTATGAGDDLFVTAVYLEYLGVESTQ